jgi:hypothetical protein
VLAGTEKYVMNNPTSNWLVLIRSLVAGFEPTADIKGI